jgi:hypothetical protein
MKREQVNYVEDYRETARKKQEVTNAIADLKGICTSLGNWRETAARLASPMGMMSDDWSNEKLQCTFKLHRLLVNYHQLRERLGSAWHGMTDEERVGLADPYTLDK